MSYNLTVDEIEQIKTYLERKDLKHEDLSIEIIDHISLNIEDLINEKDFSFTEAFELERLKWNKDLSNHSSFLLGIVWTGPKILINKTVAHTKRAYLRMFMIITPWLLLCLLAPNTFFQKNSMIAFFNAFIGGIYLVFFLILIWFYFNIRKTNSYSTYRFLFKVHVFGFGISYLLYNPLIVDFMAINSTESFWVPLIFHLSGLAFFYSFYDWHKLHMNLQKTKLA